MSTSLDELNDAVHEHFEGSPWWLRAFAVLDFETTGPDPTTALPVQVAMCLVHPSGRLHERSYVQLVDPGVEIPEEASAVHGITNATLAALPNDVATLKAATFETVRRVNVAAEMGYPLVIYNAPYDWPLLGRLAREHTALPLSGHNVRIVDPLLLDRTFDKYRRGSRKLGDVAAVYGIDPTGELHDAALDAVTAACLLRAMVQRYPQIRLPLEELMARQVAWYAAWRDDFNAYQQGPRGKGYHVEGDWPGGLPWTPKSSSST